MAAPRPTLDSVAAHAGVSRATVSRVVNGSPKVSDEVRARVKASLRQLGYVRDEAARTLVTRRSSTVAIVVCEPENRLFYDPWFGEVVRGAREELTPVGLSAVVLAAADAAAQERCADYLAGTRPEGVLLLSLHERHPLPRLLRRAGVPTVAQGRPPEPVDGLPYVDIENERSARSAVHWLQGRGRGRIGFIAGPQDLPSAQERLAGYRAAVGTEYRRSLVEAGDYTQRDGRRAMAALLDREPDLDAVFAPSDQMALGALRALHETGRAVPDDVAVVGFDDIEYVSTDGDPPLTTVHQPAREMGRALVRQLLDRHGRQVEPMIFPTHLVVRESA